MTTRRPALPARVTLWPLAPWVNVALFCGRSSTSLGCPFWNSIVMRSYPVWVPVRTLSMYADSGAFCEVIGELDPHTKAGRLGSAVGDGPLLAVGGEAGEALGELWGPMGPI